MSENHPDGFRKHARHAIGYRDPALRVRDYDEIYAPRWSETGLRRQGERCMDCGVPTCMGGCPIGNLVPDWNDLVHRGNWREALERLHATNNFPEFTGYTCPAPCETACTLACNDEAVTIKNIERAIVDRGWARGWIVPDPPVVRTGKRVAIVGSGPAGLAAAQQLNRAGHRVTVYERDDAMGGLLVYGIPDFKLAKRHVARRVAQLSAEGIDFAPNVNVGVDMALEQLRREYDAVCLAIGALQHRDLAIGGRRLGGIHFAMDYLRAENRRQAGLDADAALHGRGRQVVVIGGGDTGADCVATAHRQGAARVVRIDINAQLPDRRAPANPWPASPWTCELSYALEEGGKEFFGLDCAEFLDDDGDGAVDAMRFDRVEWKRDAHDRRTQKRVLERGVRIEAELILIAIGFEGPELEQFADSDLQLTAGRTILTDQRMQTSLPGVFAAGDANRGQSIVVWAIGEGRDVARQIDLYLMGRSRLPPSLRTCNPPLPPRGL